MSEPHGNAAALSAEVARKSLRLTDISCLHRRAQQTKPFIHDLQDFGMRLIRSSSGVHDANSLWFAFGDFQVSRANSREKCAAFAFEAVLVQGINVSARLIAA